MAKEQSVFPTSAGHFTNRSAPEKAGRQVMRSLTADASSGQDITTEALNLAGAWSDLNFDDVADALDRIRHESKPASPIDLD